MQANDWNKLFDSLKRNEKGEASDTQVQNAVRQLSEQQRQALSGILVSPEKMKAFMQSDAAKELLKKLGKKEN